MAQTKVLRRSSLPSFLTTAEELWKSSGVLALAVRRESTRNSGAMGAMQCIKYLMFVFNFLFWVGGAAFRDRSSLRSSENSLFVSHLLKTATINGFI